jgi:DNA-3-methyladenine glycosylase I
LAEKSLSTVGAKVTEENLPSSQSRKRVVVRCRWSRNDLAILYHDEEWGVPQHDDRVLFEFLILEGAQAGLSWDTILKKRENYRSAFNTFDAKKIALYDHRKQQALMRDAGIVRNRLKIAAAVQNAKAFLSVQKEFGSFDRYIWQFVDRKPLRNAWKFGQSIPASTAASDAMSRSQEARVHLCRDHDLLRLHAGDGHGERPCRRVLPLSASVGLSLRHAVRSKPAR